MATCSKCGEKSDPGIEVCQTCGALLPSPKRRLKRPTAYNRATLAVGGVNTTSTLVLSILSTICCMPPTGVVSIVFSAMAISAKDAGDQQLARSRIRIANIFLFISLGLWMLAVIANIVLSTM